MRTFPCVLGFLHVDNPKIITRIGRISDKCLSLLGGAV